MLVVSSLSILEIHAFGGDGVNGGGGDRGGGRGGRRGRMID